MRQVFIHFFFFFFFFLPFSLFLFFSFPLFLRYYFYFFSLFTLFVCAHYLSSFSSHLFILGLICAVFSVMFFVFQNLYSKSLMSTHGIHYSCLVHHTRFFIFLSLFLSPFFFLPFSFSLCLFSFVSYVFYSLSFPFHSIVALVVLLPFWFALDIGADLTLRFFCLFFSFDMVCSSFQFF